MVSSKTSAGITYPLTRGLVSMLYLEPNFLKPSDFHPLNLKMWGALQGCRSSLAGSPS